ncbi:MAG: TonB C-terminal domain-containing protein [Deltaproteobacteria bacterium]|nr:TonB C-terminal domain-containing protein [Deltaproteobacteria bacterium]
MTLLRDSPYDAEQFWKGFKLSAAAHAALTIAAVALSLAVPREPTKFLPSIRVDLVALPDVKKADLGKLDDINEKLKEASQESKKLLEKSKAKKAEPVPTPPDEMALKDKTKPKEKEKEKSKDSSKKDLQNALDRIKALAEIEKDTKQSKNKGKPPVRGNKVSQGDSATGAPTIDMNAFVSKMRSRLQENWNLPVWLSTKNLDAKVVVFLDRAGFVKNTVLAKSSGNKQFDDYCLKTIRMAQPFGAPPDDILSDGVTLGFPL